MIFLTVGTQFPFDRLVQAVDNIFEEALLGEEIFAQIGASLYKPRNFECVSCLDKRLFERWVQKASAIIGHAGMGTITMALDNEKPILVMPRLRRYAEVVNDHQVAIARKFEEFGHVLAAYSTEQLPQKIMQLTTFVPKKRQSQAQLVVQRITKFLNELNVPGK